MWAWLSIGLIAGTVAACGAADPASQQRSRSSYLHAADAVCEKTNRLVRRDAQRPKTTTSLSRSARNSRTKLKAATTRLHALRSQLGDASSDPIDAFDRRLDPFVAGVGRLERAEAGKERARAAGRLRRSGASLFAAARAAGLKHCGRGGIAIAERAVFLDYREGYLRIDDRRVARAERFVKAHPLRGGHYSRANYRQYTNLHRDELDAMAELVPPRKLRRAHQAYRRSLARVLRTRDEVEVMTFADQGLYSRVDRQLSAFIRAQRRLLTAISR